MNKLVQEPQIISRYSENIVLNTNIFKSLKQIKFQDEIKLIFFGTPEFSSYILTQLLAFQPGVVKLNEPKFVIQAVVTNPDKPVGRKQTLTQSAVSLVAQKYHLLTLKPEKLDETFIKNHLSLLECDLFLVAAYGKIIPKALLDIPRLGSINVHGSVLPKYRGASPIQQAILNGDKETGVTIMLMDEKMDHGPILYTKKISILPQDNFITLSKKMSEEGARLLIKVLPQFIQGKIFPKSQNHQKATFTKIIKKEDGYFDINNPSSLKTLDKMIRAYYPWPTTWTKWSGKIVKFLPEGMIQMEGKKVISLKDFLNGYPNFPIKDF